MPVIIHDPALSNLVGTLRIMKRNLNDTDAPVLVVDDARQDIGLVLLFLFRNPEQYAAYNPDGSPRKGEHYVVRATLFDTPAPVVFEWLQENHAHHLGRSMPVHYVPYSEPA